MELIANLPPDWTRSKHRCPVCQAELLTRPTGRGFSAWCGNGPCLSIAANEGRHARTADEACKALIAYANRDTE